MRVVIADDSVLMREGIAAFLSRAGIEVVAQAASGDELLGQIEIYEPDVALVDVRMPPTFTDEGLRAAHEIRARWPQTGIVILSQHVETGAPTRLLAAVDEHEPDVAIVDIRMPPTQTDEGIQAAHEIRRRHPDIGVVLLSHHVEVGVATQVLAEAPQRLGYLLKERVTDSADFAGSLRRVAGGGTVLDPQVVSGLLSDPGNNGPLRSLSPREREVLELVAEGRSNKAIGEHLGLSQRGVQKHVTAVFAKLGLAADEDDNRRILAVLEYLRVDHPHAAAGG